MQLAVEERGDVKIVRVQEAKLTYPALSSFFTEIRQQVAAGTRKLVIDLKAVSYIDSASISCLMDIHRLLQERSGAVTLSGLQPRVEAMISMAGVHKIIDVFREEADALAVFGARTEVSNTTRGGERVMSAVPKSTDGTVLPLVVRTTVAIDAPTSAVWAVLTTLRSIGEWDDLPDEYSGESLALGSELLWKRVDGGYTMLTVTGFEPRKRLRLSLYGSTWELPPASYDVAYTYSLADQDGRTMLSIEIGDFAGLPHGKDFYDASLEFGKTASRGIKDLAEGQRKDACSP